MCEYYRILVLLALIVHFDYLKGHCTDLFPDTTCINIDNCETLRALISKIDKTRDELNYLRKRGCGFEGLKPKICCPNYRPQCETPDGVTGQCIDIHNCSYFASMLKNNFSLQDLTYLTRSRCYGPATNSVCCMPAPPREPMEFTTPKQIDIVRDKCPAAALSPDPQSECCGQSEESFDKITGGAAAKIDQFTWLALIEYRKHSSNEIVTKCGGTLISGKYVLTAAHCVAKGDKIYFTLTSVRLGEYNTDNPGRDCVQVNGGGEDCTYGAISIPVQDSIQHPDYTGGRNVWSDIALLRLEQMATFNYFVRPLCLPTANITASPSAKLRMFVAGWGAINSTHNSSPVKLVVDLPLVDINTCQSNFSRYTNPPRLWDKQICAGGEPGKDSCSGDSGGPLMVLNKDHYEIVGIVSYGTKPCGVKLPGVYTHVYAFLDWIKTNMHE